MKQVGRAYFDAIYSGNPDPWGFATRWYERRKYALTLAALPRPRYGSAFEPGCSFGELTELLAPRCDALIAYEMIPAVAERARLRFAASRHVEIQAQAIPEAWPRRALDLVILSEVAYYLSNTGLAELASAIERTLDPGGHLVVVHYRGPTDYPLQGDDASTEIKRRLKGKVKELGGWVEPDFRIDVLERDVS